MGRGRRIRIPKGAWKLRTIRGLPLEMVLIVICLTVLGFMMLHTPLAFALGIPLWMFSRYQVRRDPQFLKTWNGHMSFKGYYHG